MRSILFMLAAFLLLAGCRRKEPATEPQFSPAQSSIDTVTKTIDTRQNNNIGKSDKNDTVVIRNGILHSVVTRANISKNPYEYIYKHTEKGSPRKDVYIGQDVVYDFEAKDKQNNNLFKISLKKSAFEKTTDGVILAQTFVKAPYLIQYVPSFDCFVFALDFFLPDSDVGDQVLVFINSNGIVRDIIYNNTFGGGGCDGALTVSEDGSYIAANYYVLHLSGKKTSLNIDTGIIAARRQVNNETLLVIEEYNDSAPKENAALVSPSGQILSKFRYDGCYDMLGYVLPCSEHKSTLYLPQSDLGLRIIERKKPLSSKVIPINKMITSDKSDQKPTERKVIITNSTHKDLVYLHDTISGNVRINNNN